MHNEGLWSDDWTNVLGFNSSIPQLPVPLDPGDDCSNPGFIDFSQKVSNFSAILLNRYDGPPVTYIVCDDQGGSQQITLADNGSAAISLPDTGIRHVNILIPNRNNYGDPIEYAIDDLQFTPIDPVWLDPVGSGYLNGPQVCGTCTDQMARGGVVVSNVSADGVTQAVVRIPANTVGETLNVTVQDENGNPCSGQSGVMNDGGVVLLGDSPGSADCNVDVTAVNTTSNGPMAFVVYLSPVNYARGSGDYDSSSRAISLKIQSDDDPNYILTANASVVRPPIVLVHGLWSSGADWKNFYLPINGITETPIDYYQPLLQGVLATNPPYPLCPPYCPDIPGSALGFTYNAISVDEQIRAQTHDFRLQNSAAAVTADVVAHSMGGDVVRTDALQSWFASDDTYGHGPVDKLITIGTPHLGSQLATDLLDPANSCVRQTLAIVGNSSFTTVTQSVGPPINGGVGDLQGNGVPPPNGSLSPALQILWSAYQAGPLPFAMALVSATENIDNLNGLNCENCMASYLGYTCGALAGDPLAIDLTSFLWPTVFGGQSSDAVVPLNSQLNNGTPGPNTPTLPGVIHSEGMEGLNFIGPTELDPDSGVPTQVINLLNEPSTGCDFQPSNGCHF